MRDTYLNWSFTYYCGEWSFASGPFPLLLGGIRFLCCNKNHSLKYEVTIYYFVNSWDLAWDPRPWSARSYPLMVQRGRVARWECTSCSHVVLGHHTRWWVVVVVVVILIPLSLTACPISGYEPTRFPIYSLLIFLKNIILTLYWQQQFFTDTRYFLRPGRVPLYSSMVGSWPPMWIGNRFARRAGKSASSPYNRGTGC